MIYTSEKYHTSLSCGWSTTTQVAYYFDPRLVQFLQFNVVQF